MAAGSPRGVVTRSVVVAGSPLALVVADAALVPAPGRPCACSLAQRRLDGSGLSLARGHDAPMAAYPTTPAPPASAEACRHPSSRGGSCLLPRLGSISFDVVKQVHRRQ